MRGGGTDFSVVAEARLPWRFMGASLLLGLLPLALGACGSGDDGAESEALAAPGGEKIREFGSVASGSQAEQAEAALRRYLVAGAAGHWSKACTYLARSTRHVFKTLASRSERVDGSDCADWLEAWAGPSGTAPLGQAKADISSVRVEGNRGYVLYRDGEDRDRAMPLKREGSAWRLAGLNGTFVGLR